MTRFSRRLARQAREHEAIVADVARRATEWAALPGTLAEFNEYRCRLLGGRPIDPEGEEILMPEEEFTRRD